jgi:hypothetical protein
MSSTIIKWRIFVKDKINHSKLERKSLGLKQLISEEYE